jgi:citrate synthase
MGVFEPFGGTMTEQIPDTANKGLEGVVAFTSEISAIVGATLSYRGFTIEDLAAHSNFEETAYLLWNNKLPNETEWKEWKQNIASQYDLPAELLTVMKNFPKTASPMEVLRTSVSLLSLWDPDSQNDSPEALHRKSIRLLAKMPALVCAWHRVRNGWDFIKPDPSKTIAQNFFLMLTGKEADPYIVKMFDTALVLHADHEMNASTFSARVTTATLSDVHSAITTAVGTLKGPLHGGANEQVMKMLEKIGTAEKCEAWLRNALDKKDKVMGFGHRVYKNGDPRAKILREMSKDIGIKVGKPHLYEMSVTINDIMEGEKGLLPNVDFYSASVYHCMGIPTDIFTPVFAVSRVAGWLSHVMEQLKGNRIIRPRSIYTGKNDQTWQPLGKR